MILSMNEETSEKDSPRREVGPASQEGGGSLLLISPIFARFSHLYEKNAWLECCSTKIAPADKISLIPDLPPVLRDMRTSLLDVRKDIRKGGGKAFLKYQPEWPFMKLVVGEGDAREEMRPEESMDFILEIYLGMRKRPNKRADEVEAA